MRFVLASGHVISAGQAIHDCFMSDIKAINYEELENGAGVQFTAKSSETIALWLIAQRARFKMLSIG